MLDSSIELIAVIDNDLRFLAVNKAFENFVHKSRNELIGNEIFVAYEGARGTKQVQMLEKVFAGRADATCRKFGGRIPGLLLTSITLLGFGFATGE